MTHCPYSFSNLSPICNTPRQPGDFLSFDPGLIDCPACIALLAPLHTECSHFKEKC